MSWMPCRPFKRQKTSAPGPQGVDSLPNASRAQGQEESSPDENEENGPSFKRVQPVLGTGSVAASTCGAQDPRVDAAGKCHALNWVFLPLKVCFRGLLGHSIPLKVSCSIAWLGGPVQGMAKRYRQTVCTVFG